MKVVVASKFWYHRGGLERVMFDEIEWLEAAGHEVGHFACAHPQNEPSPWSQYFAPYIELGNTAGRTMTETATAAVRLFRNGEAARRFGRLLDDFKPDVVHVHGIHRQLSPSILVESHRRGIPAVQTVHDYHHVCPADLLLVPGEGPCDPVRCRGLNVWPAVRNSCLRGSLAVTALSASEFAFQRFTRVYERALSSTICPSHFMHEAMRGTGWQGDLDVVPNAVPVAEALPGEGSGFVFAGRLIPEKGAEVAVRAAEQAGVSLTVIGDGPGMPSNPEVDSRIRYLGHVHPDEVLRHMQHARAVVVPSLFYENASMSVLEAMSRGVPVIASAIGGVPEQVIDGENGLLVTAGDIDQLAEKMTILSGDPELAMRMGAEGRRRVAERFSPTRHTEELVGVYQRVVSQRVGLNS